MYSCRIIVPDNRKKRKFYECERKLRMLISKSDFSTLQTSFTGLSYFWFRMIFYVFVHAVFEDYTYAVSI